MRVSIVFLVIARRWSLHYWLGRLYAVSGRTAEARRQLEEAARSDEKTLRERANAALTALPKQR